MTLPSSPKKVVVLALPGARELDLASVLDVFSQANWQLASIAATCAQLSTSFIAELARAAPFKPR